MAYGVIELPCPKCGKEQYLGEFGMLGEPCFTEEALLGFKCSNCGEKLVVTYDIKLELYYSRSGGKKTRRGQGEGKKTNNK